MSTHRDDAWHIAHTHNLSRYFIESPHIAWVLLIGTILWGIYGYVKMPQRKDPDIPIKQAMVVTPWPGASAERIEMLVTRQVEPTIATRTAEPAPPSMRPCISAKAFMFCSNQAPIAPCMVCVTRLPAPRATPAANSVGPWNTAWAGS